MKKSLFSKKRTNAQRRIFRGILGKSLLDRENSGNIEGACNVEDINGWVAMRKQEWNGHINKMAEDIPEL